MGIRRNVNKPPVTVEQLRDCSFDESKWLITFDDGGKGAYEYAAGILERLIGEGFSSLPLTILESAHS